MGPEEKRMRILCMRLCDAAMGVAQGEEGRSIEMSIAEEAIVGGIAHARKALAESSATDAEHRRTLRFLAEAEEAEISAKMAEWERDNPPPQSFGPGCDFPSRSSFEMAWMMGGQPPRFPSHERWLARRAEYRATLK